MLSSIYLSQWVIWVYIFVKTYQLYTRCVHLTIINYTVIQKQKAVRTIVQFSSVAQSCLTLCNPMNLSTPELPVCHQLPEFTQNHVHWVTDAIQPSHPLSSPSPPALNLSQHQSLFKWFSSSLLLKSNADGFLTTIVFNRCSWNCILCPYSLLNIHWSHLVKRHLLKQVDIAFVEVSSSWV